MLKFIVSWMSPLFIAVALAVLWLVASHSPVAHAGPGPATGGCITINGSTGVYTNNCAFILQQYTVATLPSCTTQLKGSQAYVSDASSPTYNGTLTGGASTVVPVFCNGSAWTSH